ncbi:MAG: ABC transporter substrate-binding protein, partial [Chloroflexota bacterium]
MSEVTPAPSAHDSRVNRKTFLKGSAAALGAAGATVAIGAVPTSAWAEKAKTISMAGKAVVTLNFAIWGNTSQNIATWTPATDLFSHMHPNIKINIISVPGADWGAYFEKAFTMIGGGAKLDMTYVAVEGVRLFGSKGLAMDLNPLIQRDKAELADFLADTDPVLLKTLQYKGEQLELPWSWNNVIMFYNTKVFKRLGIPAPKDGWTMDDFLDTCARLKKGGVYGFNVDTTGVFQNECWALAAGSTMLDPTWTKSNVLAPGTVKAFEFLHDLVWKYGYAPHGGYSASSFPLFEAGRLGMLAAGRWPVSNFDQAKFYDYDIQYLPRLTDAKDYRVIVGVDGFPIFKSTQHPEEAWTFLKFMTSKTTMRFWAKQGNNIATRKSVALDSTLMIPPKNFKIYWDSLAIAKEEGCPANWPAEQLALTSFLTEMMASSSSPLPGLRSLNTKLNQVLA